MHCKKIQLNEEFAQALTFRSAATPPASIIMVQIAGKYKRTKCENYDKFLDKIGAGFMIKKVKQECMIYEIALVHSVWFGRDDIKFVGHCSLSLHLYICLRV